VVVMRRIKDTRRWPILALIPCWKIKERQKTEKGRRRRGEHKVSKGLHLADFHYIFWLQDTPMYKLKKG
jgi:hypothetical protein